MYIIAQELNKAIGQPVLKQFEVNPVLRALLPRGKTFIQCVNEYIAGRRTAAGLLTANPIFGEFTLDSQIENAYPDSHFGSDL